MICRTACLNLVSYRQINKLPCMNYLFDMKKITIPIKQSNISAYVKKVYL